MDRKKIIQIVVIIIAFGSSGFVLYNGLYKPKVSVPVSGPSGPMASLMPGVGTAGNKSQSSAPAAILPYGNKMDFDILRKRSFQFGLVSFETVSTSTELTIPVNSFIRPAASSTP